MLGKIHEGQIKSCGARYHPPEYSEILSNVKYQLSPCGIAFVAIEEQHGILPRVLQEILTTRIAIKDAMKRCDPVMNNFVFAN